MREWQNRISLLNDWATNKLRAGEQQLPAQIINSPVWRKLLENYQKQQKQFQMQKERQEQ